MSCKRVLREGALKKAPEKSFVFVIITDAITVLYFNSLYVFYGF